VKRGEWIRTPGGGYGLYVGTSPAGVEWFAYEPSSFREMCKGFDEEADLRKIVPASDDCSVHRSQRGVESGHEHDDD
jgi:hypothetical protein